MPRGKALSDDLRGVILNIGMTQDILNIVKLTGVKRRTIERIFADYRNKGTVMREHMHQELRGRKHSLTVRGTKFLCGIVRHSPDTYLAELQEILEDRLGVDVHESTLWRSLQRCGFMMKKVIIDI
ncbi:Homeodomain-like protein, partial [Mycena latifolia]